MTVVLDLDTVMIIFVGDGEGAEALESFWKRIKRGKVNILAVAINRSPAYISAVTNNLPHAQILFDHWHAIKLLNAE